MTGFLLVSMDDDDCGNPEYCQDRAAVLEAVKRLCFSTPESLNADQLQECHGITDSLIEQGFFDFEGDPPLYLYKLHQPFAALAVEAEISEWLASVTSTAPNRPAAQGNRWPIRGVRVDGERVIVLAKGGNDAARWLCGAILAIANNGCPQAGDESPLETGEADAEPYPR